MVILNACYSETQARAITKHVDFAIGMNKDIGDKAAIEFSAAFYRAIGFGKSIQEAFDQAVTKLMMDNIPEENTPQLICKRGCKAKEAFVICADNKSINNS